MQITCFAVRSTHKDCPPSHHDESPSHAAAARSTAPREAVVVKPWAAVLYEASPSRWQIRLLRRKKQRKARRAAAVLSPRSRARLREVRRVKPVMIDAPKIDTYCALVSELALLVDDKRAETDAARGLREQMEMMYDQPRAQSRAA